MSVLADSCKALTKRGAALIFNVSYGLVRFFYKKAIITRLLKIFPFPVPNLLKRYHARIYWCRAFGDSKFESDCI